MIQKSCDPLQATERLQLVSWWYYQASCGFSCSDRFLLPNLKLTVQAHRQNRCEICLTLKEAPAQKYHQLSLSVSSDDHFHFCSSRSGRVWRLVFALWSENVFVFLPFFSPYSAPRMHLMKRKPNLLVFFLVWTCHRRLICRFFFFP